MKHALITFVCDNYKNIIYLDDYRYSSHTFLHVFLE